MPVELRTPGTQISPEAEKRIQRHLAGLERRLVNFQNPTITVTIKNRPTERRHTADVRVQLGVDGVELVSHHGGEAAEHAARLAIEDIERQLERHVATLRGKPAFGTPSRREPRDLRPAIQSDSVEPDEDDFAIPSDLESRRAEPEQ